ncbi:MAG: beta-lactamase family protein [Clostridia bacterium]|nr:beta-lactamase family protein [Clostridia bacterium]MBQ9781513.1 beta-lactamase family protein [Clostridia bacterium]
MKQLNSQLLAELLDKRMADDQANGRVGGAGLCVMQDGKEVYKKYFGYKNQTLKIPMDDGDHTIFRLASMTKPITAIAVLIQVSRGLLDLDAPITNLLPQFSDMWVGELKDDKVVAKEPAKRLLTPRMLLSHQNGLHAGDLGNRQGLGTDEDRQDLAHIVNYFSTLKLDFQPTEAQMYSATAAFDVCARLVELTSGMPYNEFVTKEIFKPLDMVDTTFIPTDDQWSRFIVMHSRREENGVGISEDSATIPGCIFENFPITWFSGGAGLCSTLPDYVKFAEMLADSGRLPDGTQLVPEALIREMGTPWVPFEVMPVRERWGLGVRVITEEHWMPKGCFGWSGAYGSHFWVDPANKITAVYMKNSRYDGGAGSQTSSYFEQDVYAALE